MGARRNHPAVRAKRLAGTGRPDESRDRYPGAVIQARRSTHGQVGLGQTEVRVGAGSVS